MVVATFAASVLAALSMVLCVIPEANDTFVVVVRIIAMAAAVICCIIATVKEEMLNDRIKNLERKCNAKEV